MTCTETNGAKEKKSKLPTASTAISITTGSKVVFTGKKENFLTRQHFIFNARIISNWTNGQKAEIISVSM